MALDHVLLGLLEQGPAHGYRLCRRIDASFGELRPVQPSRVYARLAALEEQGLVIGRDETDPRRRPRRVFTITERGRAVYRAWLVRPAACTTLLRRPLLVKVALAAHLGERLGYRMVRAESTIRARLLRSLCESPPVTTVERLVRERAVRHLEVELWLLDRLAQETGPRPRQAASRSR